MRRGTKPSDSIELNSSEEKDSRHLVRARTTGQALLARAQIVLTTHEHPEWENQRIAQTVGASDRRSRAEVARKVAARLSGQAPSASTIRRQRNRRVAAFLALSQLATHS